jgi:hypothetical protein
MNYAALVQSLLTLSISATPSRKSGATDPTPLSGERLLQLSWSHLVELVRLVATTALESRVLVS